eukprot:6178537-Pleurochrysis_carterae.AAC.4
MKRRVAFTLRGDLQKVAKEQHNVIFVGRDVEPAAVGCQQLQSACVILRDERERVPVGVGGRAGARLAPGELGQMVARVVVEETHDRDGFAIGVQQRALEWQLQHLRGARHHAQLQKAHVG